MTNNIVAGVEPVLVKGLNSKHLARVDTGAKTSSISVVNAFLRGNDLCFYLPDVNLERLFVASEWSQKLVHNSNGIELRYFVNLQIQFANRWFDTEFSLSDRSDMKYKILIGRSLLNNRFLVNSAKKVSL